MNINASRGRRTLLLLGLCAALALVFFFFSPSAHAAELGSITVVKNWDAQGNALPEAVTLYLKSGGEIVNAITLTSANAQSDGSWLGSFENVTLYDDSGRALDYIVDEEPLPGYSFSVTQPPRAEALSINNWGEKVTPASESRYPIGSANMLVANKGGDYYVWTREALNHSQKTRLLSAINATGLQGLGKELSLSNTSFANGLPSSFEDGVTIGESGGSVYVDFQRTNVWSLFYSGSYELTRAQGAVTLNRADSPLPTPTPTPSPTHTSMPTPTPTPTPTPDPDTPPKTGDTGIGWAGAMLLSSLLALALILKKLNRA